MNLTTLAQQLEIPLRLISAVVAGSAIGLNRWFHYKPAGLGTHGLVALGAALACVVATRTPGADPGSASRVVQGLVTGVGFIGAGVILRENQSQQVHGLTTAASIWVSAILGVACGWANLAVAATGLVLTVIVLVVSKPLEEALERRIGRPGDGKDDQPGGGPSQGA